MADQYHTNEAITVVSYKALFGQQPKQGLAGRVPRTFCLNIIAEVNEEDPIGWDKHKWCQQPDEMVAPIASVLIIKMPWSQLNISPRSGEIIRQGQSSPSGNQLYNVATIGTAMYTAANANTPALTPVRPGTVTSIQYYSYLQCFKHRQPGYRENKVWKLLTDLCSGYGDPTNVIAVVLNTCPHATFNKIGWRE